MAKIAEIEMIRNKIGNLESCRIEQIARNAINDEFKKEYFPTDGCDNCWGDLYQGCTAECREQGRKSQAFWVEVNRAINTAIVETYKVMTPKLKIKEQPNEPNA